MQITIIDYREKTAYLLNHLVSLFDRSIRNVSERSIGTVYGLLVIQTFSASAAAATAYYVLVQNFGILPPFNTAWTVMDDVQSLSNVLSELSIRRDDF